MEISRRGALAGLAGAFALSAVPFVARAQAAPLVIFDGQLRNGWQNSSWATVDLTSHFDGVPAIKIEGAAYSALQLHHGALSTKGFSKVVLRINGGADGGQKIGLVAANADKHLDPYKMFDDLTANTWQTVEVPLAEIGAVDTTIAALLLQSPLAYKPYYVSSMQLV